jgi:hypothetical protein
VEAPDDKRLYAVYLPRAKPNFLHALRNDQFPRMRPDFSMPIFTRQKSPKRTRDTSGYKGRLQMTVAMERILAWRIMPRLMMLAITIMTFKCTTWMIGLDAPTLNQSGFCSVVFGCFSATFAVWLGSEKT